MFTEKVPGIPTAGTAGTAIVHIGLGNFVRSHFASYLQDYKEIVGETEWQICAIDRDSQRIRDMQSFLKSTDFVYQVNPRSQSYNKTRSISVVRELVNMGVNVEKAIAKISSPEVKIVSFTVTEKGYCCNLQTGELVLNSELQSDLNEVGKKAPKTMLGLITRSLYLRQQRGLPGITLMSLDNIPGNGEILEKALLNFIMLASEVVSEYDGLSEWIRNNVTFPSTMVDRITTNTKNASDTVVCEPFRQWVIQDKFVSGRPAFELLQGRKLILTENVLPYENMKIRLLNGSHSALAYASYLMGFRNVDLAMSDSRICLFVKSYMKEAAQTV